MLNNDFKKIVDKFNGELTENDAPSHIQDLSDLGVLLISMLLKPDNRNLDFINNISSSMELFEACHKTDKIPEDFPDVSLGVDRDFVKDKTKKKT
jgi:hypothetical protein